ncbi:MAG: hypothetical protein DYH02_08175 [Candidatus Omnitrophica bacterium COP1]|nr:hypothetical protein [Candidatus Omnitrophica bacterium COP1]
MESSLLRMSASWLACWHQEGAGLMLKSRPSGITLCPGILSGWLATPPVDIRKPFRRAIPSWNILQADSAHSFEVEISACNTHGKWTPWFSNRKKEDLPQGDALLWEIDQFRSDDLFRQVRFRVHLSREIHSRTSPRLTSLYLTWNDCKGDECPIPRSKPRPVSPVQVPFIHQHELDPLVGGHICSPASVSMVLQGMGHGIDPMDVAQLAFHSDYQIYGSWPQAVHAACQYGARGWVELIPDWSVAVRYLRRGIPLVCSISFREGELESPPYSSTHGHLLVLIGIDPDGSPVTHDPNLPEPQGAFLRWKLEDFNKAWFGHGGVAYILTKPGGRIS